MIKSTETDVTHTLETFSHVKEEDFSKLTNRCLTNNSILEIINFLFLRLNWPNTGILDGEFPNNKKGIDSKVPILEDDGEFVYCIPSYCHISGRINPYDLVKVLPKQIHEYKVYYTVSATYVTKVYLIHLAIK